MGNPVKRTAAIHDLSGFGRAALTTIIPVLSTMGIQVCPLPTAVLSSNTGWFKEFSFVDLTDSMEAYIEHWRKIQIEFDCIYSGFLGSAKQADIVMDFIEEFRNTSTLVAVDPVMGDDGKLYPTINVDIVEKMKNLIKKADIIIPNLTEAAYLLDEPYTSLTSNTNIDKIKNMLVRLTDMGPNMAVITSVPDCNNAGNINVMAFDKKENKFWKVSSKYIQVEFPGTGDAFASVVIGSLLNGDSLPIAIDKSVQFITIGLKESFGFTYPRGEGILLEKILHYLKAPILNSKYELIK